LLDLFSSPAPLSEQAFFFLEGFVVNLISASLFVAMIAGCASSECKEGADCSADSGSDTDPGPSGPQTATFTWIDGANLEVVVTNVGTGTFGMAETGRGGAGWYSENCIDGPYCHTIHDGVNSFLSVHENATGVPWDGALQENETLMHQSSEENITYAVWDSTGACVVSEGHQPDYYAPQGCL
jgi:hypothetical protein